MSNRTKSGSTLQAAGDPKTSLTKSSHTHVGLTPEPAYHRDEACLPYVPPLRLEITTQTQAKCNPPLGDFGRRASLTFVSQSGLASVTNAALRPSRRLG